MNLSAVVSASAFDEYYEMALVYCVDEIQNYCFSLTRLPDQDEIEVMVRDQNNYRVKDLSVQLQGTILTANLDKEVAAQLDGYTTYVIQLTEVDGQDMLEIQQALRKIFEGKNGLQITN
jgi:hypothetical protein